MDWFTQVVRTSTGYVTVDSTTGEFHPSISGDKWVKLSRNMPPFIRFHVSDVHSPEWSNEVIQQKYG